MRPHQASFRRPLYLHLFRCAVVLAMLAAWLAMPPAAFAADPPGVGESLPDLSIIGPDQEQDAVYLGVPLNSPFALKDVQADFLIFELVGVYCPYCHKQAPLFNSLFKRLERGGLSGRVKMLALASGATAPEVAQLRKHSGYEYPVLRDEDFSVHKALNQPKTPYTLIVNKNGEIIFAKLGVIEDIDEFFATIRTLAE